MNQFFASVLFVAAGFLGNVPENLKQLVDSGQFGSAYQFAQEWRDDYEGVPEFDLYYGIAAMESGELSQAAIALDRVLMLQPSNHRARVEFGRVMFLLRDYGAAERAFSDVLKANPPASVQRRIRAFLDAIEARKKARSFAASVTLEINAGYNTNINSATSVTNISDIAALGGSFSLLEDDRKTESSFMDSQATLNITRPITEKRLQFLTLGYRDITNDATDNFNIDIASLSLGYLARIGDSQFRFPVSYQGVSIDNQFTQSFASVGFDSVTPMDRRNDWINFATVGFKRFKDDHVRDTDLLMVGSGWGYLFDTLPMKLVASAFVGEDKARQAESQGNTFVGVRAALQYQLLLNHSLYGNLLYQEAEYNDQGLFVRVREDRTSEGTLGWQWRLSKSAQVKGELSYTDNKSSLELFSYDRMKSQIGFLYTFD